MMEKASEKLPGFHIGSVHLSELAKAAKRIDEWVWQRIRMESTTRSDLSISLEEQVASSQLVIPRYISDEEAETLLLQQQQGDLAAKLQQINELEALAYADPLTQLNNKRGYEMGMAQYLKKVGKEGGKFAAISIELDHFGAKVNNRYDHNVGDAALVQVAEILTSLDGSGYSIYRVGGDEFMILADLSELDLAADELAEKIRLMIEAGMKEVEYEGQTYEAGVTASLGVVLVDEPLVGALADWVGHEDVRPVADMVTILADSAVYSAKEAGRNRTMVVGKDEVRVKPLDTQAAPEQELIYAAVESVIKGETAADSRLLRRAYPDLPESLYITAWRVVKKALNDYDQNLFSQLPIIRDLVLRRVFANLEKELAPILEMAEKLSLTDGMTGLPNWSAFEADKKLSAKRYLQTGRPISYIFIDLDGFKQANDALGHVAGDQILIEVAKVAGEVIKDNIRTSDVLFRRSGDEFIVRINEDNEIAAVVAERIRVAIDEQVFQPRREKIIEFFPDLVAGASLGVVTLPAREPSEIETEMLLAEAEKMVAEAVVAADKAMYEAKDLAETGLIIRG
jgi:diguanylate cyclase (GGDEF)-like protein